MRIGAGCSIFQLLASLAGKIGMHDFMLAKEIMDELQKIAQEKKLEKVKSVNLEIGIISMAHDGHGEHMEDIDPENLRFGLEGIAKGTPYESAIFKIDKVAGNSWKIVNVEV